MSAVSFYEVQNILLDRIRTLLRRALLTFKNSLEDKFDEKHMIKVFEHTKGLLTHDMEIVIKSTILYILSLVIDPSLNELVLKPSFEAVEPIQTYIDEISVPGLSLLFNLNFMTEGVVYRLRDEYILGILSEKFKHLKGK